MKNKLWFTLALGVVMTVSSVLPVSAASAASTNESPDGNYSMNLDEAESGWSNVDINNLSESERALLEEANQFFKYADQVEQLMDYEAKAWDAYTATEYVSAANRKQEYKTMSYTVIPNYTKFVSGLKQIKPANKQLAKIHQKYVKGAYMELEGFLLYKKMISKTKPDFSLLDKAQAKIDAGGELVDQFNAELTVYLKHFDMLDMEDEEAGDDSSV